LPLFTGLALLNFIPPERAAVWRLDCRLVEQFPLTGMGFGNFARGGPLFFPYFLDTSGSAHDALYAAYSGHVFNNHAHNLFFQVWLDLGIIGLFGFSLWLGWLIWQSWCFLLNTRFVAQTAIAYTFVAGATAFLLQSLSDASLWTARSGFTNWPLLAGLTALPNLYPKTVGAYCIRPPLNIHTYRIRPRWAIPITGLALLTLLTLNWNNLANLTERNLGNLALQATLLNASPELQTEPYRDKSSVFLAKFYALPMAILDKAQLEQAASHYRQAVETNPSDAASWRYLGIAEALEENIETARQHLAQALKVAPQDRYSAFAAGLIAYQKEDYAKAIVYWQQSRNGELFPLAHGIMEKLEPEKQSAATRDFELSLAVHPTALAHLHLAELNQRQHLWESAINHYREAIRLEPSDYYNYQQLGNLYLELRRKAEAAPVLWQALALNPGNRNLLELLEKAKT
ncbi:MAG: tetratricopeptide repeat protein, partial [Chloroflexota bacterium]